MKSNISAITGILGVSALALSIQVINIEDLSFNNNLKMYISLIVGFLLIATSIYTHFKFKKEEE